MIIQITRQSYPTDLSEQDMENSRTFVTASLHSRASYGIFYARNHQIINAIIYFLRAGCA
jgi:hypothetical protein